MTPRSAGGQERGDVGGGPGVGRDARPAAAPVPVHPEAVDGDPATLRWVVPAGLLGMVGPVGHAPAPLESLRAAGTLRAIVAEPAAVRLTLAEGLTWRAEGARVRTALQEALAEAARAPGAFRPDLPDRSDLAPGAAREGADGGSAHNGAAPEWAAHHGADAAAGRPANAHGTTDPAARLRVAVEQVLAGDVGEYIASHGGQARIVDVTAADVVLDLGGTCAACPARGVTLSTRIDAAVRALYPGLGEVRLVEGPRRAPLLRIGRRP